MTTLEQAINEYLRLSRPAFVRANPLVSQIFAGAGISLATRMWVEGSSPEPIPGTFFVALLGDPGTGKTQFVEAYLKLFARTDIAPLDVGSPEAVVKNLDENIKDGHSVCYLFFDEIDRLAKNIKGYMAPLLPTLNLMYYLNRIGQTRTKKESSVVIPAESYFVHVYLTGVPSSWQVIKEEASRGFVRRTLTINVGGEPPYFMKDPELRDGAVRIYREKLRHQLQLLMRTLTQLSITVSLPEFPSLEEKIRKSDLDKEKRRMVAEYTQKLVATKVVSNLIPFDIATDYLEVKPQSIISAMESIGEKFGVKVIVEDDTQLPILVRVDVPDTDSKNLLGFLPPHFETSTFNIILKIMETESSAPDEIIATNIEKIKDWLDKGGDVVISWTNFGRNILHTGKPQNYQPVIQMLSDFGYIRTVDYIRRGRTSRYVVLDPKAKICANCARYRTSECPRIAYLFEAYQHDPDSLRDVVVSRTPPWDKPCEKFELAEEPEPEKEGKKND